MTEAPPSDVPTTSFLDPATEVGALLPWRRYRFPIDWPAVFGRAPEDLELHLEVGFGDGRYTVRRAAADPRSSFVGLEISSASVQRAMRKVRKNDLGNVRLMKLGAQFAVRNLFAAASLRSIVVNFPDPWPKERHEEHRLLRRPFFELAASRLVPGGEIRLATDHPEYLEFARDQARESGLYELRTEDPPPEVFETKYALKWKGQGKPLHYQVFAFAGGSVPQPDALERTETMPHALLRGSLPDSVTFTKQVLPYAGGHVIVHDVARVLGTDEDTSERWTLRVTVDEPELRQQVLVSVRQRSAEELIVGIEPFGDPIITKATRGAVHAVTEWLLTQPAHLRVTRRSY